MAMLASDVNNPEFIGATSPDDGLFVQFEMYRPEDANKSAELGRKVYATRYAVDEKGVGRDTGEPLVIPYVTIMKPGDNTQIIHTQVREDHKRRWPNQWLYFQMKEGLVEDGANIPGWKLEEWPHVNGDAEALRNLKHMRFYTVEQIAGASDAQVQRMGLGGNGLREAAKLALRKKVGDDISAELAAKDKQISEMSERMARLEQALLKPVEAERPEKKAKRKYTKRTASEATA